MGNGFSFAQIPDLKGKTYVITGSNTGIGYVTAREIARKGGKVYMACRNKEKAESAIQNIKKEVPECQLEFLELDLASMKSAAQAADTLKGNNVKIDCLINNAGIMACPFKLTVDGLESQFGTNHMGHFVFTMLLLDQMQGEKRIVNLSSLAHSMSYKWGLCTLEQLREEKDYSVWGAYGHSKLCNVLFTKYLAEKRPDLKVYAVHPGYVATELTRNIKDSYGGVMDVLSKVGGAVVAKSPDNGALTSLYVATSDKVLSDPNGSYFVPTAKLSQACDMALDKEMQRKLFEMSMSVAQQVLNNKINFT